MQNTAPSVTLCVTPSPVRGNVCEADKRVHVSGRKGGFVADEDGRGKFNAECKMQNDPSVKIVSAILTSPLSGETRLAVPEREGGTRSVTEGLNPLLNATNVNNVTT